MLIAAAVLIVAGLVIEFRLKKVMSKRFSGTKKLFGNVGFSTIVSLIIAALLGTIFGAAGLTVMIAGVAGAAGSGFLHKADDKLSDNTTTISQYAESTKATWGWLWRLVKTTFLIITAPIWLPVHWHYRRNNPRVIK